MTTEILQQREDTGHAAGGDEGWTLCGLLASTVQRRGGGLQRAGGRSDENESVTGSGEPNARGVADAYRHPF